MAILSHRPPGVPVHTFTIRIDKSVYDKTVECAKSNLWSLAYTVERLLDKALTVSEGGVPNGENEPETHSAEAEHGEGSTQTTLTTSE